MSQPGECVACGARTVRSKFGPGRGSVIKRNAGRCLCQPCYSSKRAAGLLDEFPKPTDILLDEWVLLRDDGYSVRHAAPRLGVTVAALDQALVRAKRRGDVRGCRRPFARDGLRAVAG